MPPDSLTIVHNNRFIEIEDSLPDSVSKAVQLALKYAADDPAGSAQKAGRALEALLMDVAKSDGIEVAPKATLDTLLQVNRKQLPDSVAAHIDLVRKFRNTGSHAAELDGDVGAGDLPAVLSSLMAVLEWYRKKYASAPSTGVSKERAKAPNRGISIHDVVGAVGLVIALLAGWYLVDQQSFDEAFGNVTHPEAPTRVIRVHKR